MSRTEYVMGYGPANAFTCTEKCEHGLPCVEGGLHAVYHRAIDKADFEDHTWTGMTPGITWSCIVEEYEHYTGGDDEASWDDDDECDA